MSDRRVYFEVTDEKWGGKYDVIVPTWDEAELFEKITGLDYEGSDAPTRRTRGMAYLAIKRANPDFTWDDLGGLALDAVTAVVEEAEPDPTQPGEDDGDAQPSLIDGSPSSPTSHPSSESGPGSGTA